MRFPTMWYVRPAKPQIKRIIRSYVEPKDNFQFPERTVCPKITFCVQCYSVLSFQELIILSLESICIIFWTELSNLYLKVPA